MENNEILLKTIFSIYNCLFIVSEQCETLERDSGSLPPRSPRCSLSPSVLSLAPFSLEVVSFPPRVYIYF